MESEVMCMSKQLIIGDIIEAIEKMKERGMTSEEIKNTPIYIGNDDELNGIHTAWYVDIIKDNDDAYADIIEMINEDHHNIKLDGNAILIS